MKTGFWVTVIQLVGSTSGLLTIYFVAGDMGPEVYALVGVYEIVNGIAQTFAEWGIETVLVRNALYWKENGWQEKINEYVTQAVLSRIVGFVLLSPWLALYLYWLDITHYGGEMFPLFLWFLLGAMGTTLNDSMSLMVRGEGGYVFSQSVRTLNTYVLKFGGIGIYYWQGAKAYLIFYAISSVPLLCVYFVKLRGQIQRKYWNLCSAINKMRDAKYLWMKSDIAFFRGRADSFLVSLLFPASILGTYTFYKALEVLARILIEGFFDVLSQQQVKVKGNKEEMSRHEKRFKNARNGYIVGIIIGSLLFLWRAEFFIKLANLGKYSYVSESVICVSTVSILYLLGKYEINALNMFAPTKLLFKLEFLSMPILLLGFSIIWMMPSLYAVFAQRIIVFGVTSLIMVIVFRRMCEKLYLNTDEV